MMKFLGSCCVLKRQRVEAQANVDLHILTAKATGLVVTSPASTKE